MFQGCVDFEILLEVVIRGLYAQLACKVSVIIPRRRASMASMHKHLRGPCAQVKSRWEDWLDVREMPLMTSRWLQDVGVPQNPSTWQRMSS